MVEPPFHAFRVAYLIDLPDWAPTRVRCNLRCPSSYCPCPRIPHYTLVGTPVVFSAINEQTERKTAPPGRGGGSTLHTYLARRVCADSNTCDPITEMDTRRLRQHEGDVLLFFLSFFFFWKSVIGPFVPSFFLFPSLQALPARRRRAPAMFADCRISNAAPTTHSQPASPHANSQHASITVRCDPPASRPASQ